MNVDIVSQQRRWQRTKLAEGKCEICGRPALGRSCAGHLLLFRVRMRKKKGWSGDGTHEPRLLKGSDMQLYETAEAEGFNLARLDVKFLDLSQPAGL